MSSAADHQREHPPSVDLLARSLAGSGLPHPLLVDVARAAIANAPLTTEASARLSELADYVAWRDR